MSEDLRKVFVSEEVTTAHARDRQTVRVRRVDECDTLDELFRHCLPAFGGAYLRRIYTILDRAIGLGCPLTLSIAGPVTVSGQHQAWLIPLLETGWIAYLSTTDAVCYHDGHRSLDERRDPIQLYATRKRFA
jgi:deoxyhypusine synthase